MRKSGTQLGTVDKKSARLDGHLRNTLIKSGLRAFSFAEEDF